MIDNSLAVQRLVISTMQGFVPLTTLVPIPSIYGMSSRAKPNWPFIRYGTPIIRPYESSCWIGSDNVISLHAFAEGDDAWPVSLIAAQIVEAMKTLNDPDEIISFIGNEWTSTTIIPDNDEGSNWHAIVNFDIRAVVVA